MKTQLKVGDVVNVHSASDGSVNSSDHIITHIEPKLSESGEDIIWLTGKGSWVPASLVSLPSEPICSYQEFAPKASPSELRYKAYKESKAEETYFEWMNNPEWDTFRLRFGCYVK